MKVLQCIPNLAGGGAERQFCLLSRALASKGVEVHATFVPGGRNDALITDSACHLHPIASNSSYDPRILGQLYSLIRELSPDIVQTWLPQMDVLAGISSIAARRPFVLSELSGPGAYPLSFRVVARRLVGRFATAIVANSSTGLEYWADLNSSSLSRVIRNGRFPPEESSLPGTRYINKALEQSDQPLILFVGRYHPDKNVLTAAQAIISVLRQNPSVNALFLGEGPMRAQLEAMIKEANLQRRFIIGPFASNVPFWMERASVFVSISNYEGQPNAVIEAALLSTPLVLSDIRPHREFLSDEDALYVDQKNGSTVSEGIASTLRDPGRAKVRGRSASDKVSKFSLDLMVSSFLKLYSDVIESKRRL